MKIQTINTLNLTDKQLAVAAAIRQYFGRDIVGRHELALGYTAYKGTGTSSPPYISKNIACKAYDEMGNLIRNKYNLAVFFQNKTEAAAPEAAAPEAETMIDYTLLPESDPIEAELDAAPEVAETEAKTEVKPLLSMSKSAIAKRAKRAAMRAAKQLV